MLHCICTYVDVMVCVCQTYIQKLRTYLLSVGVCIYFCLSVFYCICLYFWLVCVCVCEGLVA